MKKTLDEILNRNDYVRLTATLKTRAEEIAKRIREKMKDMDISNNDDFYKGEIGIDDVAVRVKSIKSRAGEYEFLAIKREGECYGEASWYSLEDIGKEYLGASNKEALAFLNVAKKLIEGLRNIEDERVNNLQTALKI